MKLVMVVLGLVGSLGIATAQPSPPAPPPGPAAPPAAAPPATAPPAAAPPVAAPPAPAPAPAPAPPSLAAFLQQRVVEELAADGIVLSRLGVALQVEAVGDQLLLSLVDLVTGRAAASTKLDALPPDRVAAVATVTQIVANLTAQLNVPRTPALTEPTVDRDARARANLAFQAQAIGFGTEFEINVGQNWASVTRRWTAHRGELREPLAPTAFYRTVGRPDLAAAYERRRHIRIGATVGSIVMLATASVLLWKSLDLSAGCLDDFSAPGNDCADEEARADRYTTGAIVTGGIGLVSTLVWYYYHQRPHPITEGEAKQLGAQHNRNLRLQLGLPAPGSVARSRARVELGIAPYLARGGGGLALGGRF